MAQTIENHGIVGDLRTIALVGLDATIDFCCWPRFDSPTIFASILDDERGGRFELTPMLGAPRRRQLYLHDTNVLLTRSLSEDGVAEISDFMSVGDGDGGQRLVRRAKAIRNDIRFRIRCAPAFDYGRAAHRTERAGETIVFTSLGDDGTMLRLRSAVPLAIHDGAAEAEFELAAGSSAEFVLEDAALGDESDAARPSYGSDAFKRTADYWRAWSSASTYRGRWREIVGRSALVLKLLSSDEYGSTVAAGTFGLPESVGQGRNWDYRYTWLRDSAFSVYAFLRLGYVDEANAFVRWLQTRAETASAEGSLRVVYRLDGTSGLEERELPHLRGYAKSAPVRIGNGAEHQVQLDIYGELMDSLYLSDKYGEQVSWQGWIGISHVVSWIAEHWQDADQGIWEMRSDAREFLHSRLMC